MNKRIGRLAISSLIVCGLLAACTPPTSHDLILRGGSIYDGSGSSI